MQAQKGTILAMKKKTNFLNGLTMTQCENWNSLSRFALSSRSNELFSSLHEQFQYGVRENLFLLLLLPC